MLARLVEIYRREMLSFLQYVRQATPYAGANDQPLLERVRELSKAELEELEKLADYLDRKRVTLPHLGAFPSHFTNYNFVAIRKLLPLLAEDEAEGLAMLGKELAVMEPGEARDWVEKLAAAKRSHVDELQKLAA